MDRSLPGTLRNITQIAFLEQLNKAFRALPSKADVGSIMQVEMRAIPLDEIKDWPTFHDVFQRTLGFKVLILPFRLLHE